MTLPSYAQFRQVCGFWFVRNPATADGVTRLTVSPGEPAASAAAINRLLDDQLLHASYPHATLLRARSESWVHTMTARRQSI
jgi:hypothetical protein